MSDDTLSHDDARAIGEVLVRYASGIDRRDWDLFRTCFTHDCHADYGRIGVWDGVEAITSWMDQTHAPLGYTLHRISNIDIRPYGDGAVTRCYVDALVMHPDGATGTRAAGFYDDQLVRVDGDWRINTRRFTHVFVRPENAAHDQQ